MEKKVYLDSASTSRVREEVAKEMGKYFISDFGNPSSLHSMGEGARKAIEDAREKFALEIGCKPWEIIFTSGGSESNNLALQGLARANKDKRKILISAIEHPSVREACEFLKTQGFEIVEIPVNREGLLKMDVLEKEIGGGKDVLCVSVMHVNNIIGVVQDIEKIGRICQERGILFHSDCVQSFGKLDINVSCGVDLMSVSGHKINGPKGIGFLYVREGLGILPLIFGGGQERGLRSGTENVAGIVGFAKALELSKKVDKNMIARIRDLFIHSLEKIGGRVNGSKEKRIFNNIHVSFNGIESDSLVLYLSEKGIYVSAGSACDSKKGRADSVLKAIGVKDRDANGSIRISLDENIEEGDIKRVIDEIKKTMEIFEGLK